MKGDLDGPFPDQPLPARHQLERPPDRHGHDGRPALDGQEEAASPERLKIPVPAPRPLGIDEERVSFFPDQPRRPGDALLPAPAPSLSKGTYPANRMPNPKTGVRKTKRFTITRAGLSRIVIKRGPSRKLRWLDMKT